MQSNVLVYIILDSVLRKFILSIKPMVGTKPLNNVELSVYLVVVRNVFSLFQDTEESALDPKENDQEWMDVDLFAF